MINLYNSDLIVADVDASVRELDLGIEMVDDSFARSPFCATARSPFCATTRSPFCATARSPFCSLKLNAKDATILMGI
jgi:hypothetical protein